MTRPDYKERHKQMDIPLGKSNDVVNSDEPYPYEVSELLITNLRKSFKALQQQVEDRGEVAAEKPTVEDEDGGCCLETSSVGLGCGATSVDFEEDESSNRGNECQELITEARNISFNVVDSITTSDSEDVDPPFEGAVAKPHGSAARATAKYNSASGSSKFRLKNFLQKSRTAAGAATASTVSPNESIPESSRKKKKVKFRQLPNILRQDYASASVDYGPPPRRRVAFGGNVKSIQMHSAKPSVVVAAAFSDNEQRDKVCKNRRLSVMQGAGGLDLQNISFRETLEVPTLKKKDRLTDTEEDAPDEDSGGGGGFSRGSGRVASVISEARSVECESPSNNFTITIEDIDDGLLSGREIVPGCCVYMACSKADGRVTIQRGWKMLDDDQIILPSTMADVQLGGTPEVQQNKDDAAPGSLWCAISRMPTSRAALSLDCNEGRLVSCGHERISDELSLWLVTETRAGTAVYAHLFVVRHLPGAINTTTTKLTSSHTLNKGDPCVGVPQMHIVRKCDDDEQLYVLVLFADEHDDKHKVEVLTIDAVRGSDSSSGSGSGVLSTKIERQFGPANVAGYARCSSGSGVDSVYKIVAPRVYNGTAVLVRKIEEKGDHVAKLEVIPADLRRLPVITMGSPVTLEKCALLANMNSVFAVVATVQQYHVVAAAADCKVLTVATGYRYVVVSGTVDLVGPFFYEKRRKYLNGGGRIIPFNVPVNCSAAASVALQSDCLEETLIVAYNNVAGLVMEKIGGNCHEDNPVLLLTDKHALARQEDNIVITDQGVLHANPETRKGISVLTSYSDATKPTAVYKWPVAYRACGTSYLLNRFCYDNRTKKVLMPDGSWFDLFRVSSEGQTRLPPVDHQLLLPSAKPIHNNNNKRCYVDSPHELASVYPLLPMLPLTFLGIAIKVDAKGNCLDIVRPNGVYTIQPHDSSDIIEEERRVHPKTLVPGQMYYADDRGAWDVMNAATNKKCDRMLPIGVALSKTQLLLIGSGPEAAPLVQS